MLIDVEASCQSSNDLICQDCQNDDVFCETEQRIEWIHGIDKGVQLAKSVGSPLMVVIYHKNYPSCHSLFRKLNRSQDIRRILSKRELIPVKEEIKWMPGDAQKAPKVLGGNSPLYVPRVVFLDEGGRFLSRFRNKRINRKFKYFYEDVGSLIQTIDSLLRYRLENALSPPPQLEKDVQNQPNVLNSMISWLENTIVACLVPLLYQEMLNLVPSTNY